MKEEKDDNLNDLEAQNKKDDDYEEMEKGDNNKNLLQKKKKPKKSDSKLRNYIIFTLLLIATISLIYIIYSFFIKDNISENSNKYIMGTEINLKKGKVINNTDYYSLGRNKTRKFPIESIAQLPNGNIITADWITINIYDNQYNIIQKINVFNAVEETYYRKDQKKIYKIEIKDNNNFSIYDNEGGLKIYQRQGNEFILKQNIEKEGVIEIIYDSYGKIITGCRDNTIKIFELDEKREYKKTKTINFADAFNIQIFEDKNLLISKDINEIQFYDIKKKYKLIETVRQKSIHNFERLEKDKIILYTNNTLKVFSINEYKVTKTVDLGFQAYAIKLYKEKGIILVGGCRQFGKGHDKGIIFLYSENFEFIKSIEDIHGSCVKGINILKGGLIATYGDDLDNGYPINIWSLE